jgi:hypothetical protein
MPPTRECNHEKDLEAHSTVKDGLITMISIADKNIEDDG